MCSSYYEKFADGKVVCIDEEIPFEIPTGWEWVRLNSIAIDSADGPFGSNLKKEHYTDKREVRIIQLSNIGDNGWKDANTKYTTFKHLDLIKRSEAFPNDIIIAKMMPAGRAILCPSHEQKYVLSSDAVRFNIPDYISHRYLYHAINSPVFIDQVYGEVQGITRVRTSLQKLRNYLLPIPPKHEQERILQALDIIEQLVLQYESSRLSLDNLNKTIQDKLKKSILQEAIQGKLVSQDPNDEPASVLLEQIAAEKLRLVKEGLIKTKDAVTSTIYRGEDSKYYEKIGGKVLEITDEIPYDVPLGWVWTRLGDYVKQVTDFVASGSFASLRENVKYYKTENYAVLVKTQDFQNGFKKDLTYTDKHGYDFLSGSNLFGGELILSNVGSIGKVFIVPHLERRMTLAPNAIMVRPFNEDHIAWLYLLLSSPFGQDALLDISSATAIKKFNKTDFKRILIPIPPLSEQKRISNTYNAIIANTMRK